MNFYFFVNWRKMISLLFFFPRIVSILDFFFYFVVYYLVNQFPATANYCPHFNICFPECQYLSPSQIHLLECFNTKFCSLWMIFLREHVWLEQSVNSRVTKDEHYLGHKSTSCNSVLLLLFTSFNQKHRVLIISASVDLKARLTYR